MSEADPLNGSVLPVALAAGIYRGCMQPAGPPEGDGLKTCSKCSQRKPTREFSKNATYKDGLSAHCKRCHSAISRRNYLERVERACLTPPPIPPAKVCRACGIEKASSEFHRATATHDGLVRQCKPCQAQYAAAWALRNDARIRIQRESRLRSILNGRDGPGWSPSVPRKVCAGCNLMMPASEFHRNRERHDGLVSRCRACKNKSEQATKFGLTSNDLENRLSAQGGTCAICREHETTSRGGRPIALSIDHDHKTGKNRDLLCGRCNKMLGCARDSIITLERAVEYLRRHGSGE